MQEVEIEEDLLTLGLSINGSWRSDSISKKRKIRDEPYACNKFFALLQARDRMLQLDAGSHGLEDGKGLHLIHLLLISATAIDDNNTSSAIDSLTELYRNVSLNGDPIQRVSAYFTDGLAAKLLTRRSPLYSMIVANPTPEQELLAFTQLYRNSPYYQFAHFTANQVIIEAFDEEEKHNNRSLHVIDFDVSYGFQWPSLIQSLSDKATSNSPIYLRITGFGQSLEVLKETEIRLKNFAKGCNNLFFEFKGNLRGLGQRNIEVKKDETLVVNLVFYLQSLMSSNEVSATLNYIKLLNPSLVVLVEKEGSRISRSFFLSRFMESLHYFAAMFDSLDDCLPADSIDRLSIEKNHLGREIKYIVTNEERENNNLKNERLETWKKRMESNGFEGIKLSSRSISQAKLLLKIKSHCSNSDFANAGGFRIFERDEGRGLSLGWQDRHLITATSWRCAL
ncbi:scarecrow-like protein 21 [Asparagus officinalis]|nr:scarecrow-like protein 21 [Asparagus officinalis]